AGLDRHLQRTRDPLRRLFSFFPDGLRALRASAQRLEQRTRLHDLVPAQRVVGNFRSRFPCRRRVHHFGWLEPDAIDNGAGRNRSRRLGAVVFRAVRPALSDVLGRAFGLPRLAVCRAARTGGRANHPQLAWTSLYQHRDEFHVPECGLVVLRDAHSILSDVPPAFPRRAKVWRLDLFLNRVRARILRSLPDARRLSGAWTLDARWLRGLPFAGIRSRNGARRVASEIGIKGRVVS